ncbi:MAG: helicase-related protein [Bacillota bacterium]|jgi:competence protein ComFA|nr:helicase-related protein [Bacillota bacterium]
MGLFSLYLAQGGGERLFFLSPNPVFDFTYLQRSRGYGSFAYLSNPLPVGLAVYLLFALQKNLRQEVRAVSGGQFSQLLEQLQNRSLRAMGLLAYPSQKDALRQFWKNFSPGSFFFREVGGAAPPGPVLLPKKDELDEVEKLLAGRLLREREIARLLGLGSAAQKNHLTGILQVLCLTGRIFLLPALLPLKGNVVFCQRCGWEGIPRLRVCRGCGSRECAVCPECLIMGELSLCEPLYTAGRPQVFLPDPAPSHRLFSLLAPVIRAFFDPQGSRRREAVGRERVLCHPLIFQVPDALRSGSPCPGLVSPGSGRPGYSRSGFPGAGSPRQEGERDAPALQGAAPHRKKEIPGGEAGQRADLRLEVEFTAPQAAAAGALLEFGAEANPHRECLVWAACGAGKTEVSFPLIGEVLAAGKQVLFTTPRRDVVLEVAPRLARTFGSRQVTALYGGSGNQGRQSPLVVATTHQALRFDQHFDLVILDEGDAFPYPGSRMLHFGVAQARRQEGKVVYLTATPEKEILARARAGLVDIIKIPARPHGFPLPEPRFLKIQPVRTTRRGPVLHGDLLALIKQAVTRFRAQLFLFVPTVELARIVGEALRAAAGEPPLEDFSPGWIEWSHAGDRDRLQKRERFFAGKFPVLVTTTIMERGVTVPRVHVLVINADQAAVFDAPTLVQIAGRCGRSASYPTGEVWFLAPRVSREMDDALGQIRSFNNEADRAGYLRPDYPFVLQEILRKETVKDGLQGCC